MTLEVIFKIKLFNLKCITISQSCVRIIHLSQGSRNKHKNKKQNQKGTKRNHSFKYLFNEYLFVLYYMPGTVLSSEEIFLLSL